MTADHEYRAPGYDQPSLSLVPVSWLQREAALRAAVELNASREDTSTGDVLRDAVLFVKFIETGETPDDEDEASPPEADLLALLRAAQLGRVTVGPITGKALLITPGAQHPTDVNDWVAVAEKADLLRRPHGATRWSPTSRGLEVLDRGSV